MLLKKQASLIKTAFTPAASVPGMAKGEQKRSATGDVAMGKRISEARTERGMSQADLGAALGVSQGAVTQWESGATMPGVQRIEQLSRALGKPRSWLIGDAAVPNATVAPLATPPVHPVNWPRDVPVMGTAWGGDSDRFVMSGETLHYAARPPALAGRRCGRACWPGIGCCVLLAGRTRHNGSGTPCCFALPR